MSEELLTAADAAAFLKLPSVRAFYAWRRRHPVPNRVAGRGLRFYRDDLLRAAPESMRSLTSPTKADIRELARRHARGEATCH